MITRDSTICNLERERIKILCLSVNFEAWRIYVFTPIFLFLAFRHRIRIFCFISLSRRFFHSIFFFEARVPNQTIPVLLLLCSLSSGIFHKSLGSFRFFLPASPRFSRLSPSSHLLHVHVKTLFNSSTSPLHPEHPFFPSRRFRFHRLAFPFLTIPRGFLSLLLIGKLKYQDKENAHNM